MSLTLVILAAGLGTRFGGDKPLAAVGPDGQSLFEYSVHDAVKAGFTHVIFVVNDQQDTAGFSKRLNCYGDSLKVEFVVQSKSANISAAKIAQYSERAKPWGTAHAVLACRESINNPFVVINADDYYGQRNYKKIRDYLLSNSENSQTCVLPGYRMENTMSSSGGVNRGICQVGLDGYLESIREVKNIQYDQSMKLNYDHCDDHITVENTSIVSMTFWGFVPSIFDLFENEFQEFLNTTADPLQDEFYIPYAVNLGIASGLLRAKVFDTSEQWRGLTYAKDLSEVRGFISHLTDTGVYADVGSRKPSGAVDD